MRTPDNTCPPPTTMTSMRIPRLFCIAALMLAILIPAAFGIAWIGRYLSLLPGLLFMGLSTVAIGGLLLLRLGLGRDLKLEILERAPQGLSPALKRCFGLV